MVGPNGTAGTTGLLSIEDSTGDAYFRWDGYGLEIKSDDVLIETDNLTIDSQNEKNIIRTSNTRFPRRRYICW